MAEAKKDLFVEILEILDKYEEGCTEKRGIEELDFTGNPDGCC